MSTMKIGDCFLDSIRGIPFSWRVVEINLDGFKVSPFIHEQHDVGDWFIPHNEIKTVAIMTRTKITEQEALMLYLKSC